jgi:hypothetical protein
MSLEGTIVNGNVVLDQPEALPEGTRVEVAAKSADDTSKPTLLSLLKLAGTAPDLPPDFAAEHDYYIHGTSRRTPKTTP